MVYEPREDSLLLQELVPQYAMGTVLDMGAGTGILAEAALASAEKVYAADIDPEAVAECRRRLGKRVICRQSDLFSRLKGLRFDLIVFNPPYLPRQRGRSDADLDGGKHGHELLCRFLDSAAAYMKREGKVLILFSSITGKDRVEQCISRNALQWRELEVQALDFEKLYVYLVEKSDLLKGLEKKGLRKVSLFAKGHRGLVYTGMLRKQRVAVKVQRTDIASRTILREAGFVELLNKHGIGPKLLFGGTDFFAYKFVKGDFFPDYIEKSKPQQVRKVIAAVLRQLQKLDRLGINKGEMHRPLKHIIVGRKPVLIDFERARYTEKQHNVTQFLDFLGRIECKLKEKGLGISRERLKLSARNYKRGGRILLRL